ncbi:MAG: hypothetical protein HOV87_11120 [Catenulispora sp.]|nr:hypothetical protein [Catenulispora sp.]
MAETEDDSEEASPSPSDAGPRATTSPEAPPPTPATPKSRWSLAVEVPDADEEALRQRASAEAVWTPTAPMLANPLAIQRALRPLKRRVPARRERVLDETATAAQAADLPGLRPYRPVLTAADERWLSLALVIDTGPAMAMWRPLAHDLHEALLGLGAFGNVRVWHLADLGAGTGAESEFAHNPGSGSGSRSGSVSGRGSVSELGPVSELGSVPGTGSGSGSASLSGSISASSSPAGVGLRTRPGGPALHPSALLDPAGRQVVLVLSDCSGPAWWSGRAEPALHLWAAHGPTAIVQPMAEHLWRRTAVAPVPGRARTVRPGAPNTGLRFTPYDGGGFQPPGTVPVPVLETAPDWLADWARLITATGGPEQPTSVIHVGSAVRSRSAAVTAERELPIRDRVRRFHATASPAAAKLAAHVAVSVPVLPVMRLIQHRMVPGSGPAALAEVLLSGLFQPVDADLGVYGFVAGARSALLETLPRSVALDTADVLTHLSAEIDRRAGSAAETFRSLVMSAAGRTATAVTAAMTGTTTASAGTAGTHGDRGDADLAPDDSTHGPAQPFATAQPFALVSDEALRLLSHRAAALVDASPSQASETVESSDDIVSEPSSAEEFREPESPVSTSRDKDEPTVVLVLGEVHVSLLPNSTSLPDEDVLRLLSVPGQQVHLVRRPVRRASSPMLLTGVDCPLPSGSGQRVVGKGTPQTQIVVVGGIALLGSSQVRVASVPDSVRREWPWYLQRPGLMTVPVEIDVDDVADGIRQDRRDTSRLDLGSIIERELDDVRRSSLLDGQMLMRSGITRVRWVMQVVASRTGPPVLGVALDRGEPVLTVRMIGRLDDLPMIARFCEEVALHEWLLMMVTRTIERAGRQSARNPIPMPDLSAVLNLLVPLWMPPTYVNADMRALWTAFEERTAVSRSFTTSVRRIREELSE